jgi:L-fuconolactonase
MTSRTYGLVQMTPIVDTHQHLWNLGRFRLSWIPPGSALARSHVMEDYLKEVEGLNVVRTVYMEVDADPSQHVEEAEYALELCRRRDNPMIGAVIGGRPASDGFQSYVAQFRGNRWVKGVRQVLHGAPPGTCLAPEFIRGIRLLGQAGLRFDLCLRPGELLDGAKLLDACPDTSFILDHCGNANAQATDRSQWERDIAAAAQRPNVACKISGIVASAKPGAWTPEDLAPIVNHCVSVFGHDRVLFGGDWPVCTLTATLRQWIEALQWIVRDWSEENRRKLFHDNAVRIYGLASSK